MFPFDADRLVIDPQAMIIEPEDREAEKAAVAAIGSTGKGVAVPAAARAHHRAEMARPSHPSVWLGTLMSSPRTSGRRLRFWRTPTPRAIESCSRELRALASASFTATIPTSRAVTPPPLGRWPKRVSRRTASTA